MANPIKPKSTTTASKVPGSGDLITGELASNLADGVLFLKKSDGTIVTFNTGGVSSVSGTGTVSGLTLTGTVTSSGNLTLGGSLEVDGYGLPFNGITSGTITLQAVAAAGTNTITLPAITGNLITDADSGTVINKMLDNDSVTVTAGTGLSGGGAVALGGTITLDNDGVTAAAVSGVGLSISASTGSVTITSNATDANTASTIVARDASGNFSAGTITASLSGNATNVTGTVAIANGGTGKTTQQAAINALTGTQSSGKYLRSDGTNATLSSIQAADVPTLNQNTTGSSASCTGNAATATKSTNIIGGNNTTLLGSIPYQSNTDTTTLLSPNTTTTKNFLSQTGTGTNGAAPSWSAVSKSDVGLANVENTALTTWAGTSNITTLGTVGTGTWNATAIGLSKGGTNANITAVNGGIVYSTASALAVTAAGSSGQILQSNGAAAPSWVTPASSSIPTGSLFPYAGSSAPTGYLLCDGSSVSSTNYLSLHAVISNTYGGSAYTGGSGLSFNLPDLRGRFPMGAGTGTGLNSSGTGAPSGTAQTARTRGQWGGEETNLLTTNEMPSHSHTGGTGSAGSHYHSFSKPAASYLYPNGNFTLSVPSGTYHRFSDSDGVNDTDTAANHTHSITAEGGGARHNTVPPFVVLNYIIKT